MGACCSKGIGFDINEQHIDEDDSIKDKEESEKEEKIDVALEFQIFKKNVEDLEMTNDSVIRTYRDYPHYNYQPNPNNGINYILKPLEIVENDCQYYGYWNEDADKREGNGAMIWPDGSRYDGTWVDDEASGFGHHIHANGKIYIGEWLHDKTHGKGKIYHEDGAVYDGEWSENKQHGEGSESWPDGTIYTGSYRDGHKSGRGVFKWPDGSEYQGEFVNNNIEGKGVYTWNDGRVYDGEWKENKKREDKIERC